jgi:iron-sulfur cluster repair protein YtfE (RIC family)
MDPIALLKKDHREAEGLFKAYDEAGDSAHAKKQTLFEEIKTALTIHMAIEEEIFYPAVKKVRSKEVKDEIREADEEHHVAKVLIAELSKMTPRDEQFDAKVTVLKENIEHHVKEEEGELFPDAKKLVSKERLEELGTAMEARKASLEKAKK